MAKLSWPAVRRDRRRVMRRLPWGAIPGYAPIVGDSNDPETIACGFRQRLFREIPFAAYDRTLYAGFVHDFLVHNVRPRECIGFEEWLQGTHYNEERKNQLRAARERNLWSRPSRRKCEHVDSFGKTEAYICYKFERLINSRCDEFKAFSGPPFKTVEHSGYAILQFLCGVLIPWFLKHVPVPQKPRFIDLLVQAGMRYWSTDFTAFESHFTVAFMEDTECQLYRWVLGDSPDAQFICSVICGRNRMRTRSGIRATVRGRRMSGDMCTSIGNGFSNLMLALYIAHMRGGHINGFVEGDDGLFCTDFEMRASDYAAMGFTIKMEEVAHPSEASFCGMLYDPQTHYIVKEPTRFLSQFGWTSSMISAGPTIMNGLLRSKALSFCYEAPQCPIIGQLAREALRRTSGFEPVFICDEFHTPPPDVEPVPFNPPDSVRSFFHSQYGISPAAQLFVENAIRQGKLDLVRSVLPPPDDMRDYVTKCLEIT